MGNKSVTIVGVGALGSHVALFLRNTAELKVVDFDRIEQKNVLSQFHAKSSVSKNKAQALRATMDFFFGVRVAAAPNALRAENIQTLLGGSDLLIDCLDNSASRGLMSAYAGLTGKACLHGALAPNGEFGRVVWNENFLIDSEVGMGGATCEGGEHLPFIGMVATMLARSAQHFLNTGKKMGFEISPSNVIVT